MFGINLTGVDRERFIQKVREELQAGNSALDMIPVEDGRFAIHLSRAQS
jgi:hypothetical protein